MSRASESSPSSSSSSASTPNSPSSSNDENDSSTGIFKLTVRVTVTLVATLVICYPTPWSFVKNKVNRPALDTTVINPAGEVVAGASVEVVSFRVAVPSLNRLAEETRLTLTSDAAGKISVPESTRLVFRLPWQNEPEDEFRVLSSFSVSHPDYLPLSLSVWKKSEQFCRLIATVGCTPNTLATHNEESLVLFFYYTAPFKLVMVQPQNKDFALEQWVLKRYRAKKKSLQSEDE